MKRVLIVAAIAIVVALVGAFVYFKGKHYQLVIPQAKIDSTLSEKFPPQYTMHSKQLRGHIAHRELLSIRRASIEAGSMQGFLLAYSDSLLLFQYVHDFHLEGYLIVRRSDVTELSCCDTDRFQRELLQIEGVLERIDFGYSVPLQSFDSFLGSRPVDEIVIVEDEASVPQVFLIGTVSHVADGAAHINHFTGIARRAESPEPISTDRITSCQTSTNYIRFYERFFERLAQEA